MISSVCCCKLRIKEKSTTMLENLWENLRLKSWRLKLFSSSLLGIYDNFTKQKIISNKLRNVFNFSNRFETSSTTMTFALYELALNPDVQQKLRDDIKSVLSRHDNKLNYDAMLEMKYLQMVIDGKYLS